MHIGTCLRVFVCAVLQANQYNGNVRNAPMPHFMLNQASYSESPPLVVLWLCLAYVFNTVI